MVVRPFPKRAHAEAAEAGDGVDQSRPVPTALVITPEVVCGAIGQLADVAMVCRALQMSTSALVRMVRDYPEVRRAVEGTLSAAALVMIARLHSQGLGSAELGHNERETAFRLVYRADRMAGVVTERPEGDARPVIISQVNVTVAQGGGSPRPLREIVAIQEATK